MSDYRIAVCDDEAICQDELTKLLKEFELNKGIRFNIKYYEDGRELLKEKLSDFDIFFLDIEMDYIDGIEAARQIIQESPDAIIMFITGYNSYIDYAFDLKVLRYLNKPIDKDRLFRALKIALLEIDREKERIEVRDYRGELYKIKINDIVRIYIQDRKVAIETTESVYETNKTFSQMEEIVNNFDFVNTYKKRLVNLVYVVGFQDNKLLLKKNNNNVEEYINSRLLSDVRKKWLLYGRKFR